MAPGALRRIPADPGEADIAGTGCRRRLLSGSVPKGRVLKGVMNKRDICSYDYEELKEEMARIGEPPFRSRQIYEWLHVKLADDFQDMTNLSKKLREKLDGEYEIARVQMTERQISKTDPTEKFLFELWDGNMIESVLMKYP